MTTYAQRYATLDSTTAGAFYFDQIVSVDYPASKVLWGAEGAVNHASAATPLPCTSVITGDALTALQLLDNAISGAGFNITQFAGATVPIGNGVAATAVRVSLASDSTGIVSLTTSTASIGKLAANSGVDIGDVDVTSIAAGDNNIGNVDIVTVPADPFGANADAASSTGSISAKLRFIASTGIPITGSVTVGAHAVTNAGTFAVQVDGAALTALQLIDDAVSGSGFNVSQINGVAVTMGNGISGTGVQRVTLASDSTGIVALTTSTASIGKLATNTGVTIGAVEIAAAQTLATVTTVTTVTTCSTVTTLTGSSIAHDGADSGNPHKIGAKASTSLSGLTLVANADRTDLFAGVDGVLIVRPHTNLEDVVQDRATNTDGAATAFTGGLAAPGAGIRLWLTNITVANSSASFVTVDIRDGAAGAVLWTIPVPATGGAICRFDPPLKFTANTAVAYDASAATTTLTISANGFKSKV